MVARVLLGHRRCARAHDQRTAFLHCVARVEAQVQEHLAHLAGIGEHFAERVLLVDLDADARIERAPQQAHGLAHGDAQVERVQA